MKLDHEQRRAAYAAMAQQARDLDINLFDLAGKAHYRWTTGPDAPQAKALERTAARLDELKTRTKKRCPICRRTKLYAQGAFRCPACLKLARAAAQGKAAQGEAAQEEDSEADHD